MTHKEMSEIFAVMLLAYPSAEVFKGGVAKLGPTIDLWVQCLPDIDFWLGRQAVVRLCRECKYPPTIAEFKGKADAINQELTERVNMAWLLLKSDLQRRTPEEVYAAMPECETRAAIDLMGGPQALIEQGFYNLHGFEAAYKDVLRKCTPQRIAGAPAAAQKQIGGISK